MTRRVGACKFPAVKQLSSFESYLSEFPVKSGYDTCRFQGISHRMRLVVIVVESFAFARASNESREVSRSLN